MYFNRQTMLRVAHPNCKAFAIGLRPKHPEHSDLVTSRLRYYAETSVPNYYCNLDLSDFARGADVFGSSNIYCKRRTRLLERTKL